MLKMGDTLDGKYHIIDNLGQGKWGRVYLAENLKIGNRWAVKEISLQSDSRVNLLAEPEILKRLNHRSLPRIIDVIKTDGFLYIVEDYFEGRNLKELIQYRDLCSAEIVIKWGKQLCEILIYLHCLKPNPIIYRDMKPGNIIIDNDNNVKLIDFGIAREFRPEQESDSTFIGTIGYAAPEQYYVGSRADERTDIYGLGVTLYHAITGVNPGNNPHQTIPVRKVDSSLSTAVERVIARCIQHNPDDRYQSAQELLSDLENINFTTRDLTIGAFLNRIRKHFWTGNRKTAMVVEKLAGTVIVAVGGTNRGVGCTYTAIALASFLSRQNYKVAVVEMNENPVFFTLGGEGCDNGLLKGCFRKSGIDFYWQNVYNQDIILTEALSIGYNFVIVDLGRLLISDTGATVRCLQYEEMTRANIQILVSGSAVWQMKDLTPYLNEPGAHRWTLIFSAPDKSFFEQIKRQLRNNSFAMVFSSDPFMSNGVHDTVFSEILQSWFRRT